MPVHKDCILTYLNIVVVIIAIEICAIYFIFIASICIFEKRKWSKILLFNSFILLYTTYRAIFVQGKHKGIEGSVISIIHLCQGCLKLWYRITFYAIIYL